MQHEKFNAEINLCSKCTFNRGQKFTSRSCADRAKQYFQLKIWTFQHAKHTFDQQWNTRSRMLEVPWIEIKISVRVRTSSSPQVEAVQNQALSEALYKVNHSMEDLYKINPFEGTSPELTTFGILAGLRVWELETVTFQQEKWMRSSTGWVQQRLRARRSEMASKSVCGSAGDVRLF